MFLTRRYRRYVERKELQREIRQLYIQIYLTLSPNDPAATSELEYKLRRKIEQLDWFESPHLIRTATRLGIELPLDRDGWWYSRTFDDPFDIARFENVLTATGRRGARKLIKEERFRLLKAWAELLVPILALVTAILALIRK